MDEDPWRAEVGWKMSFDETSPHFGAGELKPKVQRRLLPWLDSAATYKFARGRDSAGDWGNTHTLELDLVPGWSLNEALGFQATQRLAIIRPPGDSATRYRYHTIPKIAWGSAWLPARATAESSLEAIYDFDGSAWIETKFTPLRISFPVGESGRWSLFYLLNHKRSMPTAAWRRSHVIVLAVEFDLTRGTTM